MDTWNNIDIHHIIHTKNTWITYQWPIKLDPIEPKIFESTLFVLELKLEILNWASKNPSFFIFFVAFSRSSSTGEREREPSLRVRSIRTKRVRCCQFGEGFWGWIGRILPLIWGWEIWVCCLSFAFCGERSNLWRRETKFWRFDSGMKDGSRERDEGLRIWGWAWSGGNREKMSWDWGD